MGRAVSVSWIKRRFEEWSKDLWEEWSIVATFASVGEVASGVEEEAPRTRASDVNRVRRRKPEAGHGKGRQVGPSRAKGRPGAAPNGRAWQQCIGRVDPDAQTRLFFSPPVHQLPDRVSGGVGFDCGSPG